MIVELDGRKIGSAVDFHVEIARLLDLGPYYGKNLDALWDRLSFDVERPLLLRWTHASVSRRAMGEKDFEGIKQVLERAQRYDVQRGDVDRFEVTILD